VQHLQDIPDVPRPVGRAVGQSTPKLRAPLAGAAVTTLERAVLDLLLERRTTLLSVEEVTRYVTAGADEFDARDDVENALRWLVQVNLAHRVAGFSFPTLAAVSMLE
jgi:hypothetical protein